MEQRYFNKGNRLKKKAKGDGGFVSMRFTSLYGLLQSLARFFYQKHHEWVAIAFLREDWSTQKIWFNKGESHRSVTYGLEPREVLKYARKFDAKYVIDAHNHPLSSKDRPDYGSRRANIAASYQQKRDQFGFSDTDNLSTANYSTKPENRGLKYADVVYVAGDYQIRGDDEIIDKFSEEKRQPRQQRSSDSPTQDQEHTSSKNSDCFIVTLCYGRNSQEYRRMIDLRDNFLNNFAVGRLAVRTYYAVSPHLVKVIGRSEVLTKYSKKVVTKIMHALESLRLNRDGALKENVDVFLTGFGKWETRARKATERVNPQTGEKVQVPAKVVPRFKVGKTLKETAQSNLGAVEGSSGDLEIKKNK